MNKVALFEKILAIGRVLELNNLLAKDHRDAKKLNPRRAHKVWDCLDLCVRYLLVPEPEKMFPASSGDVLAVALDNTFIAVSKICTSDLGIRNLASRALVGNRNVMSQDIYMRILQEFTRLDEVALSPLVQLLHRSIGYSTSFRTEWLELTPAFGQATGSGAKWRTLVRNLSWTATLDSLNITVVESSYSNIVLGSIAGRAQAPELYRVVTDLLQGSEAVSAAPNPEATTVEAAVSVAPAAQLLPQGISVSSENGLLTVTAKFTPKDELPPDVSKRVLRLNTMRIYATPLLAPILKTSEHRELCAWPELGATIQRLAEWYEQKKSALAEQVPQILEALVDMEAFDVAKKLTKVLTADELALLRTHKDAVLVALTDVPLPR